MGKSGWRKDRESGPAPKKTVLADPRTASIGTHPFIRGPIDSATWQSPSEDYWDDAGACSSIRCADENEPGASNNLSVPRYGAKGGFSARHVTPRDFRFKVNRISAYSQMIFTGTGGLPAFRPITRRAQGRAGGVLSGVNLFCGKMEQFPGGRKFFAADHRGMDVCGRFHK